MVSIASGPFLQMLQTLSSTGGVGFGFLSLESSSGSSEISPSSFSFFWYKRGILALMASTEKSESSKAKTLRSAIKAAAVADPEPAKRSTTKS